jgi:hypothetical protein
VGGKGGEGGEMTQALYAHMNKKKKQRGQFWARRYEIWYFEEK